MRVRTFTKEKIQKAIGHFLFAFTASELFALRWARTQYPMHKAYTVFFVVKSDTKGHDSGTFLSFFLHIILPVVILYISAVLIDYAVSAVYKHFHGRPPHFILSDPGRCLQYSIIACVSASVFAVFMLKAWKYPVIFWRVHEPPVHSEFYDTEYTDPSDVKVTFPEKKRNLVYIFMESMESSYCSFDDGGVFVNNLIPNLEKLGNENINFSATENLGGGLNLEGTSWTAAGIFSKMSGLPYFSPFSRDAHGKKTCMPGAVTLTDILRDNGYRTVFALGSDKQFENRDTFLENHSVEIHDINWYKEHGFIPKNYQIFWGFEDKKLYSIAKQELSELGQSGGPFCYGMLTVDTHFPDGYKCPLCPAGEERQIMNVIRCADSQVADLVAWIKEQSWYDNTVIVITGDHCYLNAPDNNFISEESPLPDAEQQRRWLDIILNSSLKASKDVQKNRQFSPYDMFPTVLESMGCRIQGRALGFGRSLYSGEKTVVEKYGADRVNNELMQRTKEYDALKKTRRQFQ